VKGCIDINLPQSSSPSVGARVVWSGWVGLYGRPWWLSPRQFWGTHASSGAVRPGTRKGPSTPNPTPCHYISGNRPATRRRPDGRGSRSVRHVVARGGRVERWGPCGCQVRTTPKLSGREIPTTLAPTQSWADLTLALVIAFPTLPFCLLLQIPHNFQHPLLLFRWKRLKCLPERSLVTTLQRLSNSSRQ
jgi:hypothetical protein